LSSIFPEHLGDWVVGGWVGENENTANKKKQLELGLSLAKSLFGFTRILYIDGKNKIITP
jgi:hypothetical protein